jgi:hypothetical protein
MVAGSDQLPGCHGCMHYWSGGRHPWRWLGGDVLIDASV